MGKINKIWGRIWNKNKEVKVMDLETSSIEELLKELKIVKDKKERTIKYILNMENEEKFARDYMKLSKEDSIYIEKLSAKAKEIEDKKTSLRGRLIKNNASLVKVSEYEHEIPNMMIEMRKMESRKKETESHIFYLKEEQNELYEERDILLIGHKFLRWGIVFIIACIVLTLFISFILLQTLRENTVFIFTSIAFIVMILVIGTILFNDFIDRELIKNEKLQKKVVHYLNKSKIRLFNQVKYLEYLYNKLGVDSTAKLEMYYTRYIKNKDNEKMYLKMNNMLTEIEKDMITYLQQKNIDTSYIQSFPQWILTPKNLNQIKQISKNYDKSNEQLKGLEKYEKEILKELDNISKESNIDTQVIKKLVSGY